MENSISFFTNSWVVGIATGLVVFFITDFIKRLREKREYFRRINSANREVFNTLKLLIPEKELPETNILRSVHAATAKKHNVKIIEMDSLALILDDLTKEIMDSSFLTYKDKMLYCAEVSRAKDKFEVDSTIKQESEGSIVYSNVNLIEAQAPRNRDQSTIFLFFSLLIALVTSLLLQLTDTSNSRLLMEILTSPRDSFNIFIIVVFTTVMITFFMILLLILKEQRKRNKIKIKERDKTI